MNSFFTPKRARIDADVASTSKAVEKSADANREVVIIDDEITKKWCWQFVERVGTDKIYLKCTFCKGEFHYGGSTGHLTRHFSKASHKKLKDKYAPEK
jgi:hypothetical protein